MRNEPNRASDERAAVTGPVLTHLAKGLPVLVRRGDRGGEIRRGESGRAKRIEFFRREDDSMASGRGLDAGGKTSLNGDEGRAMGI